MSRQVPLVLLALLASIFGGCGAPELCLSGERGCERAPLCEGLSFTCDGDSLWIGRLGDLPGGLDLEGGEGSANDIVMQSGGITVVIDELGEPHGLAPTGGTIIDLGVRGGGDDINSIYQIAGILPEDAFAYKEVTLVDEAPRFVAVVVRGTLDGRPEVEVVTRYELRACEPGVRARTEMYNGSPDPHVVVLADVAHWGKGNALPFAPVASQGFDTPGFGLLELADDYDRYDYVVARAAEDDAPTYGFLRCDADQLHGVNDKEMSGLGTAIDMLRPGEVKALERFISVSREGDTSTGVELVARLRRELHGEGAPVRVSGRITAEGLGFSGSVRRATVVVSEVVGDDLRRPLTTVVPDDEGRFSAEVPAASWLWYDVYSFGRLVASGVVPRGSAAELGDIEIEAPAAIQVSATVAGQPGYAMLTVQPLDMITRAQVTGSWFGQFGECAPWLGPPVAGSPACNRAIVEPQGSEFELPAGRYQLWLSAGTDYSLARVDLEVVPGEIATVALELEPLSLVPDGWLSTDLHVHGRGSFDSSLPDRDRVMSFAALGVDVIAATDHDFVNDYESTVTELALGDSVQVIGGLETTQLIPHLKVPGEDLPRVIGHFNHWPLAADPTSPRGGAPWDELVEPGQLFDEIRPLIGEDGIHMLNHPWDEVQFGRDLGYLRAIGFDPRLPIPDEDDGSRNGMLVRRPDGGMRNSDFELIEVQNGAHVLQVIKTRPLWFSLLSQGFIRTGVANSDSHDLETQLGFGRSWVDVGAPLAEFEVSTFNRALKDGKTIAGNGVVVLASIGRDDSRQGVGFAPYTPGGGDTIEIEVRAPPWVPVTEIRAITSRGETILASGDELLHPGDPLGTEGVVRFQGSFALSALVDEGQDDFVVIEAGLPFFPYADLDDDGVPDTTDNNLDGTVDRGDVEDEDDDSGPLESPADPIDENDPRYSMTRILPRAWSYGFANPFLIDWQGDGFDAPGVGGER